MNRRLHACLSIALGLLFVGPLAAQPSVSHSVPSAGQPGKTLQLTLHGANLTAPLTFWTSFPAQVELAADGTTTDGKQVKCKLTVPESLPVQIGGLVVATPAGASDVLMLMVDDLETVLDNGQNHQLADAQALTAPVAVDGVADGTASDFYRFTVTAGQRLAVEVVASRLAANLDPFIRLLDQQGNELASADDDTALGADCRISHTFAQAGEYVLEVRDNKYQSGGRYRLRIGDFPLVSVPFPLGGRLGSTVKVTFLGQNADSANAVLLRIPDQARWGRVPVAAKSPDGKSSAMTSLAASSLSEMLETEPNDSLETATSVIIPCALNGQLQQAKDRDYYEFPATKGQRLHLSALTRSLGSPSMLLMRLYNAAGNQVAETAVTDADEFVLDYTVPADGMYRLMVEDLLRRGGADHAYRVAIGEASFTLALKSDKNVRHQFLLPRDDGAFALDVQCQRQGYDGPITLQLEKPAEGFRLYNNVIPAKATTARLILAVPPGIPEGAFHALRVVGTATSADGRHMQAVVSTTALLRTKLPQLAYPPAWRDGLLNVATGGTAAPFYTMAVDKSTVYLPREIGKAQFTLSLQRTNKDFKAAVQVMPEAAPPPLSLAVKQDKDQYQVTVEGAQGLPEGRHTLRLASYGEHGGQGRLAVTEIPLEVISPLSVSVQPLGPIVAGQKQKVKVVAGRKGDDRQPISVKWKKLPPGVTGAEFTIAADQNEIEVELTAAADAPAGKFAELTVEAVTKFQGQDLTVSSPPVSLETQKSS